jgi:hypothetical protein
VTGPVDTGSSYRIAVSAEMVFLDLPFEDRVRRIADAGFEIEIWDWTRYLHEGIDVLAAAAPGLRGALLAARAAGHPHVTVDDTLIRTDRVRVAGPTVRGDRPDARMDLWWSAKHAAHGGNVQVIAAPDGWPLWTSDVRPRREHDTTALRTHPQVLPLLGEWTDQAHAVLADLGYEGERAALTTPVKTTAGRRLTDDQRTVNLLHAAVRGPAERGNSLLKTSFKALRRVSLCPWRIQGRVKVVNAAVTCLVLVDHAAWSASVIAVGLQAAVR